MDTVKLNGWIHFRPVQILHSHNVYVGFLIVTINHEKVQRCEEKNRAYFTFSIRGKGCDVKEKNDPE